MVLFPTIEACAASYLR
jgi:hypothetical protein